MQVLLQLFAEVLLRVWRTHTHTLCWTLIISRKFHCSRSLRLITDLVAAVEETLRHCRPAIPQSIQEPDWVRENIQMNGQLVVMPMVEAPA